MAKQVRFVRKFPHSGALLQEKLYQSRLACDLENGIIFPAFRNGLLSFYKAGLLFTYRPTGGKNAFSTHYKYASVIEKPKGTDYVVDGQLTPVSGFSDAYERIKENCLLYAGDEAIGVSSLYKFSYAKKYPENTIPEVVLLDIEIAFSPTEDERKINRIDFLLYNRLTGCLRFGEAKHFTNAELWGPVPKVISQVGRYVDVLSRNEADILPAYENYLDVAESLGWWPKSDKRAPLFLHPKPFLYIFGFNKMQRDMILKSQIKVLQASDVDIVFIGNSDGITKKTLKRECE